MNTKLLIPAVCPHCKEEIAVSMGMNVFTIDNLEQAKEQVTKALKQLDIPEERKTEALAWVANPDNIFTPDDVEAIISGFSKQDDTPEITEA